MTTRLAHLALAAMAIGGLDAGPFPGSVPLQRNTNEDLEFCVKVWAEVAYIKAKKSKLSASERRSLVHQWDRAYARLSPHQREQLFTTMNQHIEQETAS
jgi:hypothetical protein